MEKPLVPSLASLLLASRVDDAGARIHLHLGPMFEYIALRLRGEQEGDGRAKDGAAKRCWSHWWHYTMLDAELEGSAAPILETVPQDEVTGVLLPSVMQALEAAGGGREDGRAAVAEALVGAWLRGHPRLVAPDPFTTIAAWRLPTDVLVGLVAGARLQGQTRAQLAAAPEVARSELLVEI